MADSDYHSIAALDARIDALSDNLHEIKGQMAQKGAKSALEAFSARAGVLALVISLILGGLTLYEKTVVAPQQQDRAASEGVRARLDELSATSLTIQQAFLKDALSGQTALSTLAPKRFSLIQRAESDFAARPGDFLITDLLLMGNELINVGRPEAARAFAQTALDRSQSAMEGANAKLLMARVLSANSPVRDIAQARAFQSAALDQAVTNVSPVSLGIQMSVLGDMLSLELIERDCPRAQQVIDRAARQLGAMGAPNAMRGQFAGSFRMIADNFDVGCAIDFSAL
jgi:hypothetical protein